MRKAEVSSVVISTLSFLGIVASSFWVANVAPYLLGLVGGVLYYISAHENGISFNLFKTIKLIFVSLFGGWVGIYISLHFKPLQEYSEALMILFGYISLDIITAFYKRKDTIISKMFDKIKERLAND